MTLINYDWKQDKEDEQGYYFVLTDTLHHLDYNVVLIKDSGDIMVNGDYINNVPHELAAAIAPRLDYFMAMNKVRGQHHHKHEAKKTETKKSEPKKEAKKPEPKKEEKKSEPKKAEKKDEPKKSEKKDEKKPVKKEEKKTEKKDKK